MKPPPNSKPSSPPKKGKSGRLARDMALYSTLIVILPSSVLAGYWFGALLDRYFETGSVLAMLGLLAGAAIGFFQMYRIIAKVSRKAK